MEDKLTMKVQEGYMPYLGYQTYYRIVGEKGDKLPLVLLHGGPGSTHNKFEVLDCLAEETGRQLIMYDQIGCGESFVENRPDLWNAETWVNELIALREYLGIKECHLLGQSWGGMLLLTYVCNYKPEGVRSIILSSTLPASWMWGEEQKRLIELMPEDMQEAIGIATSTGNYEDPAYIAAEAEYMLRHCNGPDEEDERDCVRRPRKGGDEAYVVGWGPNEFTPLGTLKDYDVTEQLKDIKQPALVINGGDDMCTPYIAKYMYDHIPNSKWELFRNCRHTCYVEETEKYIELLKEWLNENE